MGYSPCGHKESDMTEQLSNNKVNAGIYHITSILRGALMYLEVECTLQLVVWCKLRVCLS